MPVRTSSLYTRIGVNYSGWQLTTRVEYCEGSVWYNSHQLRIIGDKFLYAIVDIRSVFSDVKIKYTIRVLE